MTSSVAENGAGRTYPAAPMACVGLVILLNGRLLLVQRKNDPARLSWTLPGGRVELGESAREAAVREAREETGLQVEIDSVIDVVDYIERDDQNRIRRHYMIVDFLAYVVSGSLTPGSDVLDIRLVDPAKIEDLELPPLTRDFLERHRSRIFGLD